MLKFEQKGFYMEDWVNSYRVTGIVCRTVRGLINQILEEYPDAHGYIGIGNDANFPLGKPYCEYRNGKLLTKLPDRFQKLAIQTVKAYGDDDRMDYRVVITYV